MLFVDAINFHPRNFPALFRAIRTEGIPHSYQNWGDDDLKQAFGDYEQHRDSLAHYMDELSGLPLPLLLDHCHRGVPLFEVCRYELLQHLVSSPDWYDQPIENDREAVFDRIAQQSPEALRLNLAAAAFWVDFWRYELSGWSGPRRAVGIFGNSLSYTRALSLQAEELNALPVVFEHFFTGFDHYMEVRRGPIQGFNELRLRTAEMEEADPELVYRRLAEMRNKNVRQATFRRTNRVRVDGRAILLLGQVVNDFAALTPGNRRLGTIAAYKEIIDGVLDETDFTLIIKTHPYESKKTGGRGPITYDELRAYVARRPAKQAARVRLVEDYPLESLFHEVDLVATLHSQAALEALAFGLPAATLGNPFYGRQGFTHDFDDVPAFVEALAGDPQIFELTDEQRSRYLAYMTRCFRALVGRNEPHDRMMERLAGFGVYPGTPPDRRPRPKDEPQPHWFWGTPGSIQRKARKLVRDPKLFFADAIQKRGSR